jgi:transposase
MGRKQPGSLAVERDWLLGRLKAVPDLTLRGLVAELGARGVETSYGSVWRILHDAAVRFQKTAVRHRARSSRRRAKALALEDPSGPV